MRLRRRLNRWVKKGLKNKKLVVLMAAVLCLMGGMSAVRDKRSEIDPTSCKPLLDLIAKAESSGNYNAYFGNANNSKVRFTSMTVAEVLKWQEEYVRKGSPSSAVGKYQILNTTLIGLVRERGVDVNEIFSPKFQDEMAVALLERRGAAEYVKGRLSREAFAGNLAKEWAALPKVTGKRPEKSYYAADGLNGALVSINDVLKAIDPIRLM